MVSMVGLTCQSWIPLVDGHEFMSALPCGAWGHFRRGRHSMLFFSVEPEGARCVKHANEFCKPAFLVEPLCYA